MEFSAAQEFHTLADVNRKGLRATLSHTHASAEEIQICVRKKTIHACEDIHFSHNFSVGEKLTVCAVTCTANSSNKCCNVG